MRLAIMQPYFFPYIGYFQMINAVDKFVFYDDVNFIKRGWINRNKILVNDEANYINLFMHGASPNKMINEIEINNSNNKKVIKTIEQSYSKAPFYNDTIELIYNYFSMLKNGTDLSTAAALSIIEVAKYFNLDVTFEYSSKKYADTKELNRADRLIEIAKRNHAKTYINAMGGKELYNKEYFANQGIDLKFIKNNGVEYKQFNNEFTPYLSIIDVMMFNSPERIREMLDNYELE